MGTRHAKKSTTARRRPPARVQVSSGAFGRTGAYDFAPIGFIDLDLSGVIRDINAAGSDLLGAHRSVLIGYPVRSCVIERDRGAFLEHLRRCRSGEEDVVTTLTFRKKDGGSI